MAENPISTEEITVFLGTISYRLSDMRFSDFVKTGATSNTLPAFVERLSALQLGLEAIDGREFIIYRNEKKPDQLIKRQQSDEITTRLDVGDFGPVVVLRVNSLSVSRVSYEEGSVLAKLQIVAAVVTIASGSVAIVANYPDAKQNFGVLREDVVGLAKQIFELGQLPASADGIASAPIQPSPYEEIAFYFARDERVEDAIRKGLNELQGLQ